MSDICKVCAAIKDGELYEFKEHTTKIDLGVFGEGEASIWVSANESTNTITFDLAIRGNDGGDFFDAIRMPITHCPFCGKDFSKIIFKEG